MNLYFNELTLSRNPYQDRVLLAAFKGLWASLPKAIDGENIQIYATEDALSSLIAAETVEKDPEFSQFFYSAFHRHYCPADHAWSEEVRRRFWGSEFHINIKPSESPECVSMGWAHINGAITVGLESTFFWRTLSHTVLETTAEGEEKRLRVLCVVNREQLSHSEFKAWVVSQREFEHISFPDKVFVLPEDKPIKVRDDHGREILEAFARKLCKAPYVLGVVNSLEWHPHCDHFIIECESDGIVDVCLHWYDQGYGLAVKTTAQGLLQTQKVAEFLEHEFDHRT